MGQRGIWAVEVIIDDDVASGLAVVMPVLDPFWGQIWAVEVIIYDAVAPGLVVTPVLDRAPVQQDPWFCRDL